MLLLALMVALGVAPTRPLQVPRVECPLPSAPISEAAGAQGCSALEISGTTALGAVALDAGFEVAASPVEIGRLGKGQAIVRGYAADGRVLFGVSVENSGVFHTYVPLAPVALRALDRLTLTAPGGNAERKSSVHGEPQAEAIATDDSHVVLAWNAQQFPSIRIAAAPGTTPFAFSGGASSYQQVTLSCAARRIAVAFSDGVHSATRAISVFGR